METARSFLMVTPSRFAAYLALQCALMRRFVARGGTPEEFCVRLAPAFHRRYAPLLIHDDPGARGRFDGGAGVRIRSA
jgi:hypothetical protein